MRNVGDCLDNSVPNEAERCVTASVHPWCSLTLHISEILRRSAESTMISIVRTIFGRLHTLNPTVEEAKLLNEEEPQHGEISMSMSANAADAGDSPLQASERVHSYTQQNAVSLEEPERSAASEVEGPSQALSPPRPCKPSNLFFYFCELNVI